MSILEIILCGIIILLAVVIWNLKSKLSFFKKQFSAEINGVGGKDLFENITKSKNLYKDLLVEFHPDKHVDNEIMAKLAVELSSRIGQHKSSYRELILIAKEVRKEFIFSPKFKNKYLEILTHKQFIKCNLDTTIKTLKKYDNPTKFYNIFVYLDIIIFNAGIV